jgi:hypothetical protein
MDNEDLQVCRSKLQLIKVVTSTHLTIKKLSLQSVLFSENQHKQVLFLTTLLTFLFPNRDILSGRNETFPYLGKFLALYGFKYYASM